MSPPTTSDPTHPLARFAAPTTESETLLAVCADPHVSPTARGSTKVYHRTADRFQRVLTDAAGLGVDAVVCTGDLTKDGHPDEFAHVDELLERAEVPFVAVPGNHDVPKHFDEHDTPALERFEARYTPGRLPYRVSAGEVDLIGLDSASSPILAAGHGGVITDDQLSWLEDTLADAATPVVVFHHPLAPASVFPDAFGYREHYRLQNAEAVLEVLREGGVSLVLSGHVHWPACWRAGGLRQVVAPASSSYPQAYLLVRLAPSGTEITLRPLADAAELEEAYEHARDGCDRGQAIVESTDAGALDALPFVDETDTSPPATPLASYTRR
ncbi:metallophosphoesterase family protein [Natronobiforma cellulositropha]|uniref:metallophosphoesterase family protein n=1 Tax=Natronobiforma cellulositropha TaxID=1679076 RepID=UPI0021D57832|nr:metallophosphoesterase [Natronobiforma cellulositropha]